MAVLLPQHPITMRNVDTTVNGRLLQTDAKLIRLAEHVGEFLKDGQMKRPNAWRDLVSYGVYEPFNGVSQTTNIFRGTLGEQSGLSAWKKVSPSARLTDSQTVPDTGGIDACTYEPKTYDWSIESLSYTGFRREWKSPVLCVRDFYSADKAKEQLAMILKAGGAIVDDTRITFQREVYMWFASLAGHCVVMTNGFQDFIDDSSVRFSFDPFVDDADGDEVITFPKALLPNISTLNWDYLDYCKTWLEDQAPDGAVGNDSGMGVFMAMMDKNEFEQMVYNDANLREDFRYAKPQQLIDGFSMGFKTYRGIAIAHDPQQPRWALKSIGETNATLKRVNPRRYGAAIAIGHRPETNPDYLNAEFGTIIFYLKNAYTILVPRVMTSLGSGTSFSAGAPAFNGDWAWINNRDMDTNVLGEIGYFFSRFEYHPKPDDNAANAIVLLYRRCVTPRVTRCDTDTGNTTDITTATAVASIDHVGGTGFGDAVAFTVTMATPIEVSVGSAVTLADDQGDTVSGYIASTVSAPTYTVMIQTANADFTEAGAHTIVKTA